MMSMKFMLGIFFFIFGLATMAILASFIIQFFLFAKIVSDPTGSAREIGNFVSEIVRPITEAVKE